MKSNKFIIAAIVALVPAAAALAQTAPQQLADAARNGEIATGEMGVPMRAAQLPASQTSRAEVERQAYANPTAGHGDVGMSGDATPFVRTRTRAEVRAEVLQAMRDGELFMGGEAGLNPVVHASSKGNSFATRNAASSQTNY